MGRLGEGSGENEFFWHPGHRGGADSRGKLVAGDRSRVRAGALLRPGGSPPLAPGGALLSSLEGWSSTGSEL